MTQLDLIELLKGPAAQPAPHVVLEAALRRALVAAIRQASVSREAVAEAMSAELGISITKAQVDAWTADSKSSTHRLPAAFLPAFCRATGDMRPLGLLAEQVGLSLASERDRLLAARGRLAEERVELRRRERLLRELLGSGSEVTE